MQQANRKRPCWYGKVFQDFFGQTGKEIAAECGCSEPVVDEVVSPEKFQKTFPGKPEK